ncbi:hypothetical protein OAD26_00155 [bacterium]|nr:hypothetical protein [bacterium]
MLPTFLTITALQQLAALKIDGMEQSSLKSNECHLVRGNSVGFWTEEHGVVLHPEYDSIFREGDLLKVGQASRPVTLYGIYSLSQRVFIVPIEYTNQKCWEIFKSLPKCAI